MSAEDSRSLSEAMLIAGFRSANAALQTGVALALEDLIRVTGQVDNAFVFGSFCDGWGSCLSRIDGRIDEDSDIDVTLILKVEPIHIPKQSARCHCSKDGRLSQYSDGHVSCSIRCNFGTPCIALSGTNLMEPSIDAILALPCCNYPDIAVLAPGYKSHISPDILAALMKEVRSPRCHAVAASPPGLKDGPMRVTTTLLERIVMHNLTTVQGQFFILLKFLVKKVINNKVNGLKTYMAKNLLFYMIDETPAENWRPENLLSLVKQSLQMLAAMMESTVSQIGDEHSRGIQTEDRRQLAVCMRHFFLRDAAVYLKGGHDPKDRIVNAINEVTEDLPESIDVFRASLTKTTVNMVHFQVFIITLLRIFVLESQSRSQIPGAFSAVVEIRKNLDRDSAVDPESKDFKQLLQTISEIPDCHSFVRECLRMMAHHNIGKQIHCSSDCDETDGPVGGVLCPAGDNGLTVGVAKAAVLQILKNSKLGIDVSDGKISRVSILRNRASRVVQFVLQLLESGVMNFSDELFYTVENYLDSEHNFGWKDLLFHRFS